MYLTEHVRGQAEQTEDVALVPRVHQAQHVGYICGHVLLLTADRLLSQI